MTTMQETYKAEAVPKLMQEFGIPHRLAVPKITKVVVASGVGRATQNPKALEEVEQTLQEITGQKPKLTRARKAIASFKVRQGAPVGLMVTLRGKRMIDFLERLVHVVLPRIRDFRGLPPQGFDAQGNYTLGIREQLVFPEIPPDQAANFHGLAITITTTAANAAQGRALLAALGFPFEKEEA